MDADQEEMAAATIAQVPEQQRVALEARERARQRQRQFQFSAVRTVMVLALSLFLAPSLSAGDVANRSCQSARHR